MNTLVICTLTIFLLSGQNIELTLQKASPEMVSSFLKEPGNFPYDGLLLQLPGPIATTLSERKNRVGVLFVNDVLRTCGPLTVLPEGKDKVLLRPAADAKLVVFLKPKKGLENIKGREDVSIICEIREGTQ